MTPLLDLRNQKKDRFYYVPVPLGGGDDDDDVHADSDIFEDKLDDKTLKKIGDVEDADKKMKKTKTTTETVVTKKNLEKMSMQIRI